MKINEYLDEIQLFIEKYISDNIENHLSDFAGFPNVIDENNQELARVIYNSFYNDLEKTDLTIYNQDEILIEPSLLLKALSSYPIRKLYPCSLSDSDCDIMVRKYLLDECLLNVCKELTRDIISDVEGLLNGEKLPCNTTNEIIARYIFVNKD